MRKNRGKNQIIINMLDIQLKQRKFTTSEIGRGVGYHENKKYSRKQKHKKSPQELT